AGSGWGLTGRTGWARPMKTWRAGWGRGGWGGAWAGPGGGGAGGGGAGGGGGPLVMVAAGGVRFEVLRDRRFALPPVDRRRALALLDRLGGPPPPPRRPRAPPAAHAA